MGMYQQIRNLTKSSDEDFYDLNKKRLIEWRKEPVTVRIERPTRLDRARAVGYRAKEGIILVRQKILKSRRMRPQFRAGRRSKAMRRKKIVNMSYQWICEQRAARKFLNCEVLNSYFVARDGKHEWYEIILVDRNHPAIKKDKLLSWITLKNQKMRAQRGLTSAAKRSMMTSKIKG